jgi:hypothetical protein
MKDPFDSVTSDMFEKGPDKKVSKPTGTTYVEGKAQGEKAAKAPVTKAPGVSVSGGGSGLEKGMMGGRFKPTLHAKGGMVSSASKRADGCAIKGKTRGKIV